MNICNKEKFDYKFLKKEDIDALMALIDEVYEELEDKKIFKKSSREDLLEGIEGAGVIIGVYLNKKLVAYRYLSIVDYDNSLAKEVEDTIYIEKEKIIQHESAMVHKSARGNGIQNITRKILESEFEDSGFRYFMSTVSPDNKASYRNVLKEDNGFSLVGLVRTYYSEENPDGLERFVFFKDIKEPLEFASETIKINPKDKLKIKNTLKNQFYGVGFDGENIIFKKVLKK